MLFSLNEATTERSVGREFLSLGQAVLRNVVERIAPHPVDGLYVLAVTRR